LRAPAGQGRLPFYIGLPRTGVTRREQLKRRLVWLPFASRGSFERLPPQAMAICGGDPAAHVHPSVTTQDGMAKDLKLAAQHVAVPSELGPGAPVDECLSREVYGGLKTNTRWLSKSTQLEVICHPVQDVIVSMSRSAPY